MLNRMGRARDKHMESSTNAQWELNQGSNKALSALCWLITHRGVRPRKKRFLPALITTQESRENNSPAPAGIIVPFPWFQGGGRSSCFLFFLIKTLAFSSDKTHKAKPAAFPPGKSCQDSPVGIYHLFCHKIQVIPVISKGQGLILVINSINEALQLN